MKKQKLQMILILCILVLCVGGYIAAKNIPEKETETVASQSYTVTNVAQDNVVEMSYLYEGNIIELIKEEDEWKSKEDTNLPLSQALITTMLDYVCRITSDTIITEVDSLADYGLTNPSNTICLTLNDGSVVQVLVGDYLDITGDNYILLAGDPNVYTISSYTANSFQKSLEDLVEVKEETESVSVDTIAVE